MVPALSLRPRIVLVRRHPVRQFGSDGLEVTRAAKLLRAQAFGHFARKLRDVTLLGGGKEDTRDAKCPQLRSRGAATLWIEVFAGHRPMLGQISGRRCVAVERDVQTRSPNRCLVRGGPQLEGSKNHLGLR